MDPAGFVLDDLAFPVSPAALAGFTIDDLAWETSGGGPVTPVDAPVFVFPANFRAVVTFEVDFDHD